MKKNIGVERKEVQSRMKYCCKKFNNHITKNGSIFETPESPQVWGIKMRMKEPDNRHVTDWIFYCPFCGTSLKDLGVE